MFILNGSTKSLTDTVVETMVKDILTGLVKSGDKVTSVREQAKLLQVNPQTVQKAYNQLIENNILVPKRGSGNYLTNDQDTINKLRTMFIDMKVEEFNHIIEDYNLDRQYIIKVLKEKDE